MKYCSDENRVEILAGRGVITVLHTQVQRDKVHITLHLNFLHSYDFYFIVFFGLLHELFLVMLQLQIIMILLMYNNLLVQLCYGYIQENDM